MESANSWEFWAAQALLHDACRPADGRTDMRPNQRGATSGATLVLGGTAFGGGTGCAGGTASGNDPPSLA